MIPFRPRTAAWLLPLGLAACISVPEDELARLDALEADWLRPVDVQADAGLLELQEAAIRRRPELRALLSRYKAALRSIVIEGALEDPQVRFGYFLEAMDSPMGKPVWSAGVSQQFPFYGKRDLRAEAALHEAHALREQLVEARFDAARMVALAYWELYYLDRSAEITRLQIVLLEDLAQSIEGRFLSGSASRADLLALLMEIDAQRTELENLGSRAARARAELNALLDRDALEPLAPDFAPAAPDAPLGALDDAALLARARDFGPVRASAHMALRQEAALGLARLGYFPDVMLGYDYMAMRAGEQTPMMTIEESGKDTQILGIGFNLPLWWNRIGAGVDQARERLAAELSSRQEQIRRAERGAVAALEAAREQERNRALYAEQLIPKAEEKFELSELDYIGGRVDLDRLIDAERDLLDLRLRLARSVADRAAALATLDYFTAGGLGLLPAARPAGAEDIPEIDAFETLDLEAQAADHDQRTGDS